jgi:putative Ca2+/H+ antiporter (TMEM165/GDT1 family)
MISTFLAIFLAEMGDKTQLATMSLSATGQSKWMVFFGAALALVASTAVAVLAGDVVARYVPAHWIRRAAGALFIGLGAMMLLSKGE